MSSEIYYHEWEADHPRAALYIVHGVGEHCGRYEHVADWFNQHGVAVYSGDYPGFGRTPGRRGHVDSFESILDAIEQGYGKMVEKHPHIPHFLLGHSLGGLLVTEFLLTRDNDANIDGAIITSPGYRHAFDIPTWKKQLAKLLTPLFPSLALPSGIPLSSLSRDADVVQKYEEDPLTHDKVSLRFYQEMNRVMASVFERIDQFPSDLPVYWMQAGGDTIVSPDATKEYFDLLPPHPQRRYKEWPDLYHEILNEPEKEEVLGEIWSFMQEVMQNKSSSII